jgi:hypothetical protein
LTPVLTRPPDLGDFLVGDHYFFQIETFAEIWLEVLTGRLEKKTIPARLVNLQIKPVDQLGAPFIDGSSQTEARLGSQGDTRLGPGPLWAARTIQGRARCQREA